MSAARFALSARPDLTVAGMKRIRSIENPQQVPVVDTAGSPLGVAIQVRRWRRLLRRPTVLYRSPVPLDGRSASGCWSVHEGRLVLVEVMLVFTPGFPIPKAPS